MALPLIALGADRKMQHSTASCVCMLRMQCAGQGPDVDLHRASKASCVHRLVPSAAMPSATLQPIGNALCLCSTCEGGFHCHRRCTAVACASTRVCLPALQENPMSTSHSTPSTHAANTQHEQAHEEEKAGRTPGRSGGRNFPGQRSGLAVRTGQGAGLSAAIQTTAQQPGGRGRCRNRQVPPYTPVPPRPRTHLKTARYVLLVALKQSTRAVRVTQHQVQERQRRGPRGPRRCRSCRMRVPIRASTPPCGNRPASCRTPRSHARPRPAATGAR